MNESYFVEVLRHEFVADELNYICLSFSLREQSTDSVFITWRIDIKVARETMSNVLVCRSDWFVV